MEAEIQLIDSTHLNDLKQLISIFEQVFEMEDFNMPADHHLQTLLGRDHFFAVVAKVDDRIIGGLTVYVLDQYYSTRPLAYIYDLAVLNAYQRQGIGRKLIDFTNNYCRQRGFEEVFVQADKVDAYALDFYRTTRPSNEEQVVHFYYSLNQKLTSQS